MNFLQEKTARRFFAGVLLLGVLGLTAGAALAVWAAVWGKNLLNAQALCLASTLLDQGVAPDKVAAALSAGAATPAGRQLLAQMGYARAPLTPGALLGGALGAALALGGAQAAWCAAFLARRDTACRAALQTVQGYAKGDFSARLPWDGTGAPGQLFAAVDALASALRASAERERQSKAFLKETISDISHQLKTPLAALALYNEILAADPADAAAVRRFTAQSATALARTTALVQMLLKLARLDAGGIVFETSPQTVRALAERAAAPLCERAVREHKTLTLAGPEAAVLCCDPAWTVEALGNLIKNALDHTKPGGRVAVGWQAGPAALSLTVADDGAGIPLQDIHHIFKRFYRGDSGGSGVGLGLPLAKAIVEGQGGVLCVESEVGQGSVFRVMFPVSLAPSDEGAGAVGD